MVRRIGSTKERPVLARFIAATNRDLHEMSLQGGFRQDLYYRLNVMSLVMPPLRERLGDLVLLAEHFASQTSRRYGLPKPAFTPEALDKVRKYSWPGNVRELKHQISRAVLLCGELGRVTEGDLALPGVQLSSCSLLGETEKILMLQALTNAKNNVSKAARELGISRMAMRYRMEKHNIQID
jgi:transcriptional regulator with GAF, ATPase, and Fis domain